MEDGTKAVIGGEEDDDDDDVPTMGDMTFFKPALCSDLETKHQELIPIFPTACLLSSSNKSRG